MALCASQFMYMFQSKLHLLQAKCHAHQGEGQRQCNLQQQQARHQHNIQTCPNLHFISLNKGTVLQEDPNHPSEHHQLQEASAPAYQNARYNGGTIGYVTPRLTIDRVGQMPECVGALIGFQHRKELMSCT